MLDSNAKDMGIDIIEDEVQTEVLNMVKQAKVGVKYLSIEKFIEYITSLRSF